MTFSYIYVMYFDHTHPLLSCLVPPLFPLSSSSSQIVPFYFHVFFLLI
jgi:hypothetical protein